MHIYRFVLPVLTALLLVVPTPLTGQRAPGFGGIEGRVGLVLPDDADTGLSGSVDVDLGYVGSPMLRTIVGVYYFTADVSERRTGGQGSQTVSGSLTGIGGRAGLRLDFLGASRIGPYASLMLAVASIDRNADSPTGQQELEDVYSGVLVGASVGAGVAYALDQAQRMSLVVEGRRVFAADANLSHWGAEVGLRLTARGRRAYDPVFVYRDPLWRDEAAMTAAERERLRLERERLERERLEAERLRGERELTERERLERERIERERLAQMTEAERERARLEAERLEEARRLEAEGRAAAEREAEQLRAEREAAEAAAREAEIRAAAAEQRLYQALLDLDRLLTNITEIRETERGLVVVLGQGLFASGQSALSPQARSEVRQIAAALMQFPEHRISVEGHTDSVGSEAANQRLSEQRAESVRAALIAEGVDPARTDMLGYGQNRPIADNATAQGRAQNRRVEIVILGARRPAAMP